MTDAKVVKSSKKGGAGSKPGERRGGRAKGVKNKATQSVIDKLEALDCDPIEGMVQIAQRAIDADDLPLAGQMYKELAQYVAPKRKAIEVTGADGDPIEVSSVFNFIPVSPDS